MNLSPVKDHVPTPWLAMSEVKLNYYCAVAHYHAAVAVVNQSDSGDIEALTERFDNIHVWSPYRKEEESVAAQVPTTREDREVFGKMFEYGLFH